MSGKAEKDNRRNGNGAKVGGRKAGAAGNGGGAGGNGAGGGGKLTQDEINRIVWKACDTFRSVIDANDYKDYILVMLFVKYISDVWKAAEAEYRAQGWSAERIRRRLGRERFVLPEGATFGDLHARRNADNIGELMDIAISAIEEANPRQLSGVFRGTNFNSPKLGEARERNAILRNLLEDFAHPRLDLRPDNVDEDAIGEAYMHLIERFGSEVGKKAGEFYTPASVRHLLARLAAPAAGATIHDPACGSASLLIDTAAAAGGANFSLSGQENNESTVALAKMNIFLHGMGAGAADIRRGDVLRAPKFVDGGELRRFDVVVANPPFSLEKWGAEAAADDPYHRFWRGLPPKSKGDWAFVSHMLEAALPQRGRVVVVVPHGVLFRGGAEGAIRRKVLEENLLDAVIGLPANLFSTTGIPVALLVFDRRRELGGELQGRRSALFVDASRGYAERRNRNELREEDIKRIERAIKRRRTEKGYAYLASAKEIADNDYNLNIPRYVDTFEEEAPVDIAATQREIERLEGELAKIRGEMRKALREMGALE